MDENGKPKSQAQIAVINGMHDGKVPLPAELVNDVKKYADLAGLKGGYDGLKAGDEYDMHQFVSLFAKIQEAKKAEAGGWAAPDIAETKNGVIQRNLKTGEPKPATQAPDRVSP